MALKYTENDVISSFPLIYRKHPYLSVGAGWSDIVYEMSAKLEAISLAQAINPYSTYCNCNCSIYLHQNGLGKCNNIFTWGAQKQHRRECGCSKFSVPSLYISQMKEKFGTLRVALDNCIDDKAYDIVEYYENLSASICDTCGEAGTMRNKGWVSVRCDNHVESEYKNNN